MFWRFSKHSNDVYINKNIIKSLFKIIIVKLHRSANNGFVFVGKRKIISEVILWRRIRIRNQNQPITSGFWDIWGYMLEKWGFLLLLRLCTGRKKFFWFFLKCHHLALLFPFKMNYWTVTSDVLILAIVLFSSFVFLINVFLIIYWYLKAKHCQFHYGYPSHQCNGIFRITWRFFFPVY